MAEDFIMTWRKNIF